MFLHCLDNLFRYSIIKLPPLKKVNFSSSNCCFPLVGFVVTHDLLFGIRRAPPSDSEQ